MKVFITENTMVATPKFTPDQIVYCKDGDAVRQVKVQNVQIHVDQIGKVLIKYAVIATESVGYAFYAKDVWEWSLRGTPNEFFGG